MTQRIERLEDTHSCLCQSNDIDACDISPEPLVFVSSGVRVEKADEQRYKKAYSRAQILGVPSKWTAVAVAYLAIHSEPGSSR
jgi:hypothetical protein